jgi:hypothetical protein
MARERRALGKSILEKKIWLKEQLSGLFITKSLNLQAEECTFKPRVNIIIFMHLSTVTVWEGEPNTAWSMGEKYGNGKKYHFSFPHWFFLQVFLSQLGKKLDQGGKYYIVSPQAHIQEAGLEVR